VLSKVLFGTVDRFEDSKRFLFGEWIGDLPVEAGTPTTE
jgi:hypothetical protein